MKGTREGCLQLLVTDAVKVTESCKAVCVGGEGGWAVGMRGQLARVTEGPSLGLLQGARLTGVPYPLTHGELGLGAGNGLQKSRDPWILGPRDYRGSDLGVGRCSKPSTVDWSLARQPSLPLPTLPWPPLVAG